MVLSIPMISFIAVFCSLIGDYLNVKKKWTGFLFWLACDIYFLIYNFNKEEYAQACLFTIYMFFALWGIYSWKK
jgi:nicotinamide riboside transporter PnuC